MSFWDSTLVQNLVDKGKLPQAEVKATIDEKAITGLIITMLIAIVIIILVIRLTAPKK